MRKKLYYQYDFEDVYGKRWEVAPENPYRSDSGQIDIGDYYDSSILGEETKEEWVCRKMKELAKCRIMCRTIQSGEHVETEIYPLFIHRRDVPRQNRGKKSREAQKKLNHRNRQKKIVRRIHCNFKKGDLIMTLTYKDGYYPDLERAKKDIKNYLLSIARYRKKQGMSPLKYIYVIEFVPEEEDTRKVRIHHHVIMSAMDRDVAESKWTKGRRECKYADPDTDFGLEGFARYITKLESDGKHLIQCSRNLKKPTIHESVTKLTRRKMRDMVMAEDGLPAMMEMLYRGKLRHIDTRTYYSDWVGGFYLYSRLKRREEAVKLKKGISFSGMEPVKIYIDYDWKSHAGTGCAEYSIRLEREGKEEPIWRQHHGTVKNTTKERAILWITLKALKHFKKKCCIEVHAPGEYLAGGFNLCRFQKAHENDFSGTINADLIEKVLKAAAGHSISVVAEDKNKYSDWATARRQEDIPAEQREKTVDDRR